MSNIKTNKENHNLKENSKLGNLLFSVDIILFLVMCSALALWRTSVSWLDNSSIQRSKKHVQHAFIDKWMKSERKEL